MDLHLILLATTEETRYGSLKGQALSRMLTFFVIRVPTENINIISKHGVMWLSLYMYVTDLLHSHRSPYIGIETKVSPTYDHLFQYLWHISDVFSNSQIDRQTSVSILM